MKLISTLPERHIAILKPLVDGLYKYEASGNYTISLAPDYTPSFILTTSYSLIAIHAKTDIKPIGLWKGGKANLLAYRNLGALIAYHHKIRRGRAFSSELNPDMILLGFRSLDELRRIKPFMLITSLPIRAAYYGINLMERERRPKGGLPLDVVKITLSKEQLALAIENIKAIRRCYDSN
ncbi:MAG: hypothetical protein DDT19_02495 [Syntrophomonadaceae bacterium]|nr:hypothetical protein [Bacillota bacterium]